MKRLLVRIASVGFVTFGLALAFIPQLQQVVATTTTVTITGWNIPNGTTLNHGLVALILPLVTMGAFAGLGLMFVERGGSMIVTMALVGYIVGAAAGMLAFPTGAAPTVIPFANAIIAVILLIIWLWKGEG